MGGQELDMIVSLSAPSKYLATWYMHAIHAVYMYTILPYSPNVLLIVMLATPLYNAAVCTPPCVNGACVATNACSCSMGYTAPQCDIPIITECDTNVCQNGGSCSNVAGSVICSCLLGYGGSSCEIEGKV